jgi:hypothetical protein
VARLVKRERCKNLLRQSALETREGATVSRAAEAIEKTAYITCRTFGPIDWRRREAVFWLLSGYPAWELAGQELRDISCRQRFPDGFDRSRVLEACG